jgi:hypothetical protein
MMTKPKFTICNDRHCNTTDDHDSENPNISKNSKTNSTKGKSTKSQELFVLFDTKLVSLQ